MHASFYFKSTWIYNFNDIKNSSVFPRRAAAAEMYMQREQCVLREERFHEIIWTLFFSPA